MAEIFLAEAHAATGGDKLVALKMIHPRYAEERHFHRMMVEEARIAVQLGHPNIGQVFDLGQYGGRYFLVMEFIDGFDLSRTHEACRAGRVPFPVEVAAYVGHEVAAALAYAHQLKDRKGRLLGLIHRDISPQNVLLAMNGEVKIIDFGIAKVATQMQQTQVGVIKGKFYYMSPEQAGAQDVDQRSDLFSLGICLWETVVGRSLFRRDDGPTNPLAILHEVRSMPIPRVRDLRPDCPQELDSIIARGLARDLSVRFANAEVMREALARFLAPLASRGQPSAMLADFMGDLFRPAEVAPVAKPQGRAIHVTTGPADRMSKDEFAPTDASVIFSLGRPAAGQGIDLDWMDPATATRILESEGRIPRAADIARAKSATGASLPAVSDARSRPPSAPPEPEPSVERLSERAVPRPMELRGRPPPSPFATASLPRDMPPRASQPPAAQAEPASKRRASAPPAARPPPLPPLPQPASPASLPADEDLAFSDTVFVRKDAVESTPPRAMAAVSPSTVANLVPDESDFDEPEDPNVRTMHVDAKAIRAAHEAFAERMAARPEVPPPPKRPSSDPRRGTEMVVSDEDTSLSSHPLFRWLVVLILVLCVLTATLALLLVRRRAAAAATATAPPGYVVPSAGSP